VVERVHGRLRRLGCQTGRTPLGGDVEAARKKDERRAMIERLGPGFPALVSRTCACGSWTFGVRLELKLRACCARLWGGILVS